MIIIIPLCPLLSITFLARLHWAPLKGHMCKLAKVDGVVCQSWETTITFSSLKLPGPSQPARTTARHTSFSYECTWSETEKRPGCEYSACPSRFHHECVTNLPLLRLSRWPWWEKTVPVHSPLPHPHQWWQEAEWCCSLHTIKKKMKKQTNKKKNRSPEPLPGSQATTHTPTHTHCAAPLVYASSL